RWPEPPEELKRWVRRRVLSYLPIAVVVERTNVFDWRMAVVATRAATHFEVCQSLLAGAPNLNTLLVEKPWGLNHGQCGSILHETRERGVALYGSDHYLLRSSLRWIRSNRSTILDVLGEMKLVRGALLEKRCHGPA